MYFPVSQVASNVAGSISIACWVVVLVPQLYTNYKRKSSDSLSTTFLLIWFAADLLNLVGAIMQNLLVTMIVLAFYYNLTDIILLSQVYYYRKFSNRRSKEDADLTESTPLVQRHRDDSSPPLIQEHTRTIYSHVLEFIASISCLCITGIISYYLSVAEEDVDNNSLMLRIGTFKKHGESLAPHLQLLAQSLGWGSAILYLGSRIPQIVMNFNNRSCEGLSLAMFYFSVLGNLTYCMSVLFHSVEREFILINLPWLIGSGGTLFFDFMIFFQFYLYRNSYKVSLALLERKQIPEMV